MDRLKRTVATCLLLGVVATPASAYAWTGTWSAGFFESTGSRVSGGYTATARGYWTHTSNYSSAEMKLTRAIGGWRRVRSSAPAVRSMNLNLHATGSLGGIWGTWQSPTSTYFTPPFSSSYQRWSGDRTIAGSPWIHYNVMAEQSKILAQSRVRLSNGTTSAITTDFHHAHKLGFTGARRSGSYRVSAYGKLEVKPGSGNWRGTRLTGVWYVPDYAVGKRARLRSAKINVYLNGFATSGAHYSTFRLYRAYTGTPKVTRLSDGRTCVTIDFTSPSLPTMRTDYVTTSWITVEPVAVFTDAAGRNPVSVTPVVSFAEDPNGDWEVPR